MVSLASPFSNILGGRNEESIIVRNDGGQNESKSNIFPCKLFDMLEDAAAKNFDHIVSWENNGLAFKVHDPKTFTQMILPMYFKGQTKFKSFLRQVNLYSFKRSSHPADRGKRQILHIMFSLHKYRLWLDDLSRSSLPLYLVFCSPLRSFLGPNSFLVLTLDCLLLLFRCLLA